MLEEIEFTTRGYRFTIMTQPETDELKLYKIDNLKGDSFQELSVYILALNDLRTKMIEIAYTLSYNHISGS